MVRYAVYCKLIQLISKENHFSKDDWIEDFVPVLKHIVQEQWSIEPKVLQVAESVEPFSFFFSMASHLKLNPKGIFRIGKACL